MNRRAMSGLGRRAPAAGAAAAVILAVLAAVIGPGAGADSRYRVDAIFDTAKGIIPGQVVKIAGARVGTIEDVSLTSSYKARIQMSVDRRFAPFRADARCSIQPEALVGENFVQCDPGTPAGGPLRARGDHPPTVPVTRTSVPVNLTDLFNIFSVPVRQRIPVVVATLGIGVAGRGEDINDVIRRANPTLALVRRAVEILSRQRVQLASTVRSTDRVVAELARRRSRVRDLIDRAERVTAVTADRRRPLARSIRRLPPLLDATRPAVARLDRLATDATPLLVELRASAPDLQRLVTRLEPFSQTARPALEHLGDAAQQGRETVRSAGPVVGLLRRFAREAGPTGQLLRTTLVDLQDRGFVEGLLSFVYYAVAATSRYDSISHILPSAIFSNECSQFAQEPVPGCSANFDADSSPTTPLAAGRRATGPRRGRDQDDHRAQRGKRRDQDLPSQAAASVPSATDDGSRQLLDFLLEP